VFEKSKHYIFAWVHSRTQQDWILACIYGDASYKENLNIWRAIKYQNARNVPMCCVCDFNAIKDISEKWGGKQRLNQNNTGFREFLFEMGLIDLGFKGPAFTLINKPNSSCAMHIRLDRAIANPDWCNLFPEAYVNHMPCTRRSDHAPIMIRTRGVNNGDRLFRIEHWWLENKSFQEAWKDD
jgi:hypothetical protein